MTPFLFASFLTSYPPDDFVESLLEFLAMSDIDGFAVLESQFDAMRADPSRVEDIRARYIDLFDRGRCENPLYESEYGQGRAFSKGGELVDIAGFYRAFGFAHGCEGSVIEMLDHIAVELEFYALMLLKEHTLDAAKDWNGKEIVFEARCKFLEAHLGRFASVIASRPLVVADPYFGPLFACVSKLVEDECKQVGVSPLRPNWYASESEEEQMLCGATNHLNEDASNLIQIR